jgi:hypothetical protein
MTVPVKVDEDLPGDIANLCKAAGHDAMTVYLQGYTGFADDQLWPKVQQEQRMLFTADKGFANARNYPPGSHAGVVLFRLPRESRAGYMRLAEFLLAHVALDDIAGRSWLSHRMRSGCYERNRSAGRFQQRFLATTCGRGEFAGSTDWRFDQFPGCARVS